MNTVLLLRDSFIKVYNRFDYIVRPLIRFVLALIVLSALQGKVGYFTELNRLTVILFASAVCCFLPFGGISFIAGIFLLLDMAKVSYMLAVFGAGLLMLILMLYYGFKPGTGILMSLVPLAFYFKVPFLVPVVLGMSAGVYSVIPAALGVVVWNLIRYFSANAAALGDAATADMAEEFIGICRGVMLDKYMIAVIAAFIITVIVVSIISGTGADHSWTAAVIAGIAAEAVIFIFADIKFGGSLMWDMAGIVISLALSLAYEMIFYCVDYSGTEKLKFEDDDYYYYVKAVPKAKPYDPDERRE